MTTRAAPVSSGSETQTVADEMRAPFRETRLTFILSMSFVVHLILTVSTLATPAGLYTLLVYAVLLCLVSYTLSRIGIDQGDLREALYPHVYPPRIRTPLHTEFLPYIGVWLAWWTVTELFRAAMVRYNDLIVWQFFFFPALVILVTWLRSNASQHGSISLRAANGALLVLQIVTAITLFFPTASWVPQHGPARLTTALRATLYFFAVFLFDYVKPARTEQTLHDSNKVRANTDATVRRMIREGDVLEQGLENSSTAQQRREQIVSIVAAYEAVAQEHARVYEIATLNAWILVSPFIVAVLGFLCTSLIFFVGAAQNRRHTGVVAAAAAVTASEPVNKTVVVGRRAPVATSPEPVAVEDEPMDDDEPRSEHHYPSPPPPPQNQRQVSQTAPPSHAQQQPTAASSAFYVRGQGIAISSNLSRPRAQQQQQHRDTGPAPPAYAPSISAVLQSARSDSPAPPPQISLDNVLPGAKPRPFEFGI